MKRKDSIFDGVFIKAGLPGEPCPGIPVIEILGEHRVLVENHFGVSAYNRCNIQILVKFGSVCVTGSGLCLSSMTKSQIIITGCITGVSLIKR